MIRFIISFTVCLVVVALAGWGAVAWFPDAVETQGLLVGLIAGLLGSVGFWLTFVGLLPFDLD